MNQKLLHWLKVTLRQSAWAPMCILVFYVFAMEVNLFASFPILDIPAHFLGGIALTYFYRSAVRNSRELFGETPHPIQVLLALTLTSTTTVLWELYEITLDFFFETNKIRGLEDTLTDLFVGLLGALFFSLLYRRRK